MQTEGGVDRVVDRGAERKTGGGDMGRAGGGRQAGGQGRRRTVEEAA